MQPFWLSTRSGSSEPHREMGAGIAASPHCAERRICRCSVYLVPLPERFGTPLLDPGSPAQASPPIEPLPLSRSRINLPDCAARRFAGLSTVPARLLEPESLEAKTVRCSAALLGMTSLASRFAHQSPRGTPGAASRDRKITSSGASSRLARSKPESSFHCLPAEIGPLVTRRAFLPLPAFRRGRDRSPDHPLTMHLSSESRKRKMWD